MLFRNLKTGNVLAATDKTSIELMQRSANYEAVEAPAPAPEAKATAAVKKTAAKPKAEAVSQDK